ncbi:MAG: SGNH/GDSL hydrolase family protein [Catenulispora sp.]|nr:SGNH/GDSL hydrolase family protein [Catenulispora sp.]
MDVVTLGQARAQGDKRYARPDSVGTRLRAAAVSAAVRNSIDLGAMTTPPTITASQTQNSALTMRLRTVIGGGLGLNSFTFRGGTPTVFAGLAMRPAAVHRLDAGNLGSNLGSTGGAVEFYSDAPKIEFAVTGGTTTYQIEVDGQAVAASPRTYEFTGGAMFVTLDFGGVRKSRRYRWETDSSGGGGWDGVAVTPADSVWAVPKGLRVAVVGDSLVEQTGATDPNGGYAKVLGKLLGWDDVWCVAIGGTGFSKTNAGVGGTFGSSARVSDVVTANPDLLVIPASQNDAGLSTSQLTADALAAYQAYRTALPKVPIICGGVPAASSVSATAGAAEDAVKAAFDSWADKLSWWIPVTRANDTGNGSGWLFGNGNTSTPANNGNNDVMIGSDGAHPTQHGHNYLARRYAAAIRQNVLTSPRLT